jgi:ammonia channel protein AmtB
MGSGRVPQRRQCDGLIKVLDFAGGTVVHINSGVAGLMACIVLGKRKETGPDTTWS